MNKYILMLGVAAVSIGSYAAYAGNSATMTVTATIAHDVSLSVTHDLNMGTITVDPSDFEEGGTISLNPDGTVLSKSDNIISYSGFSAGTFTANVSDSCKVDGYANPGAGGAHPCFKANQAVITLGNAELVSPDIFYDSGNKFKLLFDFIVFVENTVPQSGTFDEDILIEYVL
ncbi:MAG: DUF4402 domain-containing protein [Alphaproteobacteria bacterium]|nr:DUF4402 domain-containing protein [Alphaproteobacteria bacterium]